MAAATDRFLLALNAGSSSLKFALYRLASPLAETVRGTIERIGTPHATLTLKSAAGDGPRAPQPVVVADPSACIEAVFSALNAFPLDAVGHRIVHGGGRYSAPHPITVELLQTLRDLSPFDPEHLPLEIAFIAAIQTRFPQLRQVACFDTAFHDRLPVIARRLPIPRRYDTQGIRRYGFHGLAYQHLMSELVRIEPRPAARTRVILAHLGNGASLAAVRDGQSIDTTMSFTPAAGIVMGTRTGDLDPGVLAYLIQTENRSATNLQRLVNHESGLLGISETSGDMRDLLAREDADPRAAEAVAIFCYQAKKALGAYVAALGGLDTLVFSGGIGEHCPSVRARICDGLTCIGLELDPSANAAGASVLSTVTSPVTVRMIPADEERTIAQATALLLASPS